MGDEIIDDLRDQPSGEDLKVARFKVVVTVLVGATLHFIMVLNNDFIPEPFMENDIRISIHGILIFVVMLCQAFVLSSIIEATWAGRKVISNVLLISGLIFVSEVLLFLCRDLYFNYKWDYDIGIVARFVVVILGLIGLIVNIRIRKMRKMSTKGAWWLLVVSWVAISQIVYHFDIM